MRRFRNHAVGVTGGGSGTSAAMVRRKFAEGASILAIVVADISDLDEVFSLINNAVARFEAWHGLVNCAGIRGVGAIADADTKVRRSHQSINVAGTFYRCQAFARIMTRARGAGTIGNLSSAASIRRVAKWIPKAASKYVVAGLSQTMALERGWHGIRVNAIVSGMVRTRTIAALFRECKNVRRIRAARSIGREEQPGEIASTIVFPLAEYAGFIIGLLLSVKERQTTGIASHGAAGGQSSLAATG